MQCSNCNAVMDDYCRVVYNRKSSKSEEKPAFLCRCPRCRSMTIVELDENGRGNGKVLYNGREYINETQVRQIPLNVTKNLRKSLSKRARTITNRLHQSSTHDDFS